MSLSRKLFLSGFGIVASLASLTAAPPPGMRWSDQTGVRGSTPSVNTTGSTVVRSNSAVSGQTVTIRGADGVLRSFPLAGTAVVTQGQGGQSPAAIQSTPPAAMPPAPLPATTPKKI